MNKGDVLGRFTRIIVALLMVIGLSALFQINEAGAATKGNIVKVKGTPKQQVVIQHNHHVSKSNIQPTQVTQKSYQRTPKVKPTSTQYIKHTYSSSNHVVPNNSQKYSIAKRKGASFSRETAKPKHQTIAHHATVHHKVTPATVKSQKKTKVVHPVHKRPQWLSQTTKARKVSSSSKSSKVKTSRTSKVVSKSKSTLSKISKSKVRTAKPVKSSVKTSVRTATKTIPSHPQKNYYNKPPKRWPSNVPDGDNGRDFGQMTKESGIDDALKIMKKSGNKGVSIEHTQAKDANIGMILNWNPTAKQLSYGTGTAIGRHTILTANHVVNDRRAHKPLTPSQPQNIRIYLTQGGFETGRSLQVSSVKVLQYGDVALVYTYEDISKYMKIRKIASETTIKSMKANTPIHMYHYGTPTGKYKNDPTGTMYHSKGKYSMTARNVNPIGYYQMMAEPGSSGGAVLNSKNEIIGIHAFRVNAGDYKKYHLNSMGEIRGKLRKEIIDNIV
ncbi:trypsin-like serine peptidase [Staphylococcus caprae]|uniref:trypsin-like serine peptidase n=1 Tax=Staphylococcus caprae TaxID=29380 RepID=UPI00254C0F44|nr:trypsin-like peptidase domain-containing protein [Staphylococcus caprae]MDK6298163.1 trypsin-like peptidase domain-containing protein [Staphylococcus caprae]MDK7233841.1 trypsin-like peptidase domain-containing protein [Staphylococcus caprae]